MESFREQLRKLLNKFSSENASNTPDFILVEYLLTSLINLDRAIKKRDDWYNVHLEPGNKYFNDDENIIMQIFKWYKKNYHILIRALSTRRNKVDDEGIKKMYNQVIHEMPNLQLKKPDELNQYEEDSRIN